MKVGKIKTDGEQFHLFAQFCLKNKTKLDSQQEMQFIFIWVLNTSFRLLFQQSS